MKSKKIEADLSEKDKKEIEVIFSSIKFDDATFTLDDVIKSAKSAVPVLAKGLIEFEKDKKNEEYHFLGLLTSILTSRSHDIETLALAIKFKNSEIKPTYLGYRLSSILGFYGTKFNQSGEMSHQAYRVRELFSPLAVKDTKVIQAYGDIFKGPYKSGAFITIRIFTNILHPIIQNNLNEYPNSIQMISDIIKSKTPTQYEKNAFLCLKAILESDPVLFDQSLVDLLLHHHKNTLFDVFFDQYFCKIGHAVYNLAKLKGLTGIREPKHKYWDSDFQHFVELANESVYTDWIEENFSDTPGLKYILLEPRMDIEYEDMVRLIVGVDQPPA